MFRKARFWRQSFWINFSWDKWVPYLNGRIAKFALLFPIIGYLIIFNDYISEQIDFSVLTSSSGTDPQKTTFFLGEGIRLKLVYYGLFTLALSSALFLLWRPFVVKQGKSLKEYMDFGLEYFTVYDFRQMHGLIRERGHESVYGKYYDDEWDVFLEDARWTESGSGTENWSREARRKSREHVSFSNAKKTHEDVLRSMLIDTYKRETAKNKHLLAINILIASSGYILMVIPSIDLFLRVTQVTLMGN